MTAMNAPSEVRDEPPGTAEPWGQQGVLGMAAPALAKISLLCVFIACLLWQRSASTWDRFEWQPPGRSIELASVMGRIKLSVAERGSLTSGGAQYDSSALPYNLRDGWQPGWAKTIGMEVTSELDRHSLPATVLRIRWHLIVFVLSLFPAAYYFRQWRLSRARDSATT